MVYWDQLGCGINDYIIDDSFTIEHYVTMTIDLIKQIKQDFPLNRILLFGVSWGSILAAKGAYRIPDLIDGVIVYGQVLKNLTFNNEVFSALENSQLPDKDRAKLTLIKNKTTEPDLEDLKTMAAYIRKYTEGYQCKSGEKTPLGSILYGLLTSPDYSLKNFKAVVMNGTMKNKSLLLELMNTDLSEIFRSIKVPYYILQGDTDIVTSTEMIKKYISDTDNSFLHFEEIGDSGHMPSKKAMDAIINKIFDLSK